jgi:hypothetical protein
MLVESANSFIAVWFIPTVAVQELVVAFCHMDSTFLQSEQILELSLDEQILYQRNIAAECMTSSAMGPLTVFTHVRTKINLLCNVHTMLVWGTSSFARDREEGSDNTRVVLISGM